MKVKGTRGTRAALARGVRRRKAELARAKAKLKTEVAGRKQAEQALREAEHRLYAVLDSSPSLIFLKDLDGRYLYANPQFQTRLLRLTQDDVAGRTDEEIFPPEQAAAFRANDRRVLESGAPLEFEEVAQHADGPHISIVIKFPLRNSQGRVYAIGGIVTDITERKRAEKALRELSARLVESQNEERRRIARELYDSTSPALAGVLSRLHLLKDRALDLDDKASAALNDCLALAEHVAREIRNLSEQLQPLVLDQGGLIPAIRWCAEGFEKRTGIPVQLNLAKQWRQLPQRLEVTLFRIVQEVLSEMEHHSSSGPPTILLRSTWRECTLEVRDQSGTVAGDLPSQETGHSPLEIKLARLRENIRQLGGTLVCRIDSGVAVRAAVPVRTLA